MNRCALGGSSRLSRAVKCSLRASHPPSALCLTPELISISFGTWRIFSAQRERRTIKTAGQRRTPRFTEESGQKWRKLILCHLLTLQFYQVYDKNTLLYTVFFYCVFVFCVIDFHFHIYLNLILLSLLLKRNLTSELQKKYDIVLKDYP